MVSHIDLYEGEQGDCVVITGRNYNDSCDACLSFGVEADSSIDFKSKGGTLLLSIDGTCDFTFSDPTVTWVPTDAQLTLFTAGVKYNAFVHIRNDATPQERVLKFTIRVLNT
jgi:hypothetical protein